MVSTYGEDRARQRNLAQFIDDVASDSAEVDDLANLKRRGEWGFGRERERQIEFEIRRRSAYGGSTGTYDRFLRGSTHEMALRLKPVLARLLAETQDRHYDLDAAIKALAAGAAELAGDSLRPLIGDRRRYLTVFHGNRDCRADVLILDPSFRGRPRLVQPRPNRVSWWSIKRICNAFGLATISPQEAVTLLRIFRPEIVLAPAPKMIPLAVPWPNYAITTGEIASSSGALVRDRRGNSGLTAAFHGTGGIGTMVTVDGRFAKVGHADPITDTVFIALPPGVAPGALRATAGLLKGLLPREYEALRFFGATSGQTTTQYIGRDQGLPRVRAGRQLCIQTLPNVERGDSGAALITQDEKLVGFAFQRTALGEVPEFADWIWAESALLALDLTLESKVYA